MNHENDRRVLSMLVKQMQHNGQLLDRINLLEQRVTYLEVAYAKQGTINKLVVQNLAELTQIVERNQ